MKMGVEVEWHLVDERGNRATNHSAVVSSAKRVYDGSGDIHPEAINDLVEMVTEPPTENFEQLRTILIGLKDALVEGARQNNVYIAGTATTFSSPSPDGDNAGMHMHVEANIKREKVKFHNLILHVAPEIVALSTNSPIYNKRLSGYKDYRLYRTPHVREEEKRGYTTGGMSSGERYEFVTVDTKDDKPTVEVRGIDTPMNIDWVLAFAALIRCLAEKGQFLFLEEKRNTPYISEEVRHYNYEQAVKYGLEANFISDPNIHMSAHGSRVPVSFLYHQPRKSITIPAYDAAKRLLYFIEDVADDLELKPYLKILYNAVSSRKNQADTQIEWFNQGFVNYVYQITSTPKQPPTQIGRYHKQGGYLYVRQGDRRSGNNEIQLHPDTITSLRTQERQTIRISTMEGREKNVVVKMSSRADRGKLTLGGRAIGMKKRLRREIGVSLFDPVKVGLGVVSPIPSVGFVVRTGCREDVRQRPSRVRMHPDTIRQLGIQPNQTVKIVSSSGTTDAIVLSPPENMRLNSEDITLCKNERSALGVRTGDQVEVRTETTTEQPPPSVERPIQPVPPAQPSVPSPPRTFTVRMGYREDIRQRPSRVRMHPDTIRQLGIQPNQTVKIASSSGTIDVIVLPPPKNIRLNLEDVALCKNERGNLGVRTGDQVEVRTETITEQTPPSQPVETREDQRLPPVAPHEVGDERHVSGIMETLRVTKGFNEDINKSPPVVRMAKTTISSLGYQPNDVIEVTGPRGTITPIVLPPPHGMLKRENVAVCAKERRQIGVDLNGELRIQRGTRQTVASLGRDTISSVKQTAANIANRLRGSRR